MSTAQRRPRNSIPYEPRSFRLTPLSLKRLESISSKLNQTAVYSVSLAIRDLYVRVFGDDENEKLVAKFGHHQDVPTLL